MSTRYWLIASAVAVLGACSTYKGLYYDPSTGGVHARDGDPQATVLIGTISGAEIRSVNGRQVIIGGDYLWVADHSGLRLSWEDRALEEERNRRQEYRTLKGRPGRYELEVGIYSSRTEVVDESARRVRIVREGSDRAQRLTPFEAGPGRYWVTIVKFKRDGADHWAAVVVPGAGERIVAAPDQRLVGLTTAQAAAALEGRSAVTVKELLDEAFKPAERPAREPAPAERHYAKGRELHGQRNYAAALKELDQALALDPELDVAHVYKGIVLHALGRPAEALPAIERGMRLGREKTRRGEVWFWWPNHHRGLVLMQLGRIGDAVASFDEEVRLNPTARAYAVRGAARIEQAQQMRRQGNAPAAGGHLRRAAADLEEAARRGANDPFVWNNKARAHFELNDAQAACDAVRKACKAGDCRLAEEFTECGR